MPQIPPAILGGRYPQAGGRNGGEVAVCVHLDQLEIAAMEILIQKIVIELQRPQLC